MQITANKEAQKLIDAGLARLQELGFTKKLYAHDGSLWKQDAENIKFIESFLGWTEIYDWSLKQLPEVQNFAAEVKGKFDNVVLMGMGGSSLAPEVLRTVFGRVCGAPRLIVLDSTNPDWVAAARAQADPARTLFIFASKSGGTVEPASQFAYFYDEVSKVSQTPGDNFIAITDPGTGLETLAKQKNFRKIFLNPADIGGRFSALSMFGVVPAALCGLPVEDILKGAQKAAQDFKAGGANAPASLGALLGAAYGEGKDKLILLLPSNIAALGLWVEQLVAESTGKEGKGIVPVAGEVYHKDFEYAQDRVFVCVSCPGADSEAVQANAFELAAQGKPVAQFNMAGPQDIGAQFLLWEVATAAAGAIMQINPFDQPNVQLSKTIAKGILDQLAAGQTPEGTGAQLLVSAAVKTPVKMESLAKDICALATGPKDYIAVLAYLNAVPAVDSALGALRDKIFTAAGGRSVLFGYGPRYLHSTGQLHKGDSGNGVFLVITGDAGVDVKIPGQKYTFGQLCDAQGLADFKALGEKGRRAIKIHLNGNIEQAISKL